MSDDPKKSPGTTDELPTLRNRDKPGVDAPVNSAEAETRRKPSGTVIISEEAAAPPKRPITEVVEPKGNKTAVPAAGKTDIPGAGRPVSKTLPSDLDDAPKRPGLTAIDPPSPRDLPLPRRVPPKKNGNLVFVIAGAALLAGAIIGGGIYAMRSGNDEGDDVKPLSTEKKPIANPTPTNASTAGTTPEVVIPPVVTSPVVAPIPSPTNPSTIPTTTTKPTTSPSSSATPQNPFPFPTGFPTVIPTALPTFPSAIPIPSVWPPPN